MILWSDGNNGGVGNVIRATVKGQVESVNRKVVSRGIQAVNALRNAELEVLEGQRSGRVYKKPSTYGEQPSKSTRKLLREYGHKLRGGQLYRASAPGEAPAKRNGDLRLHWNKKVKQERTAEGGVTVTAELESGEKYAYYLEKGKGMAPRPFVERIKQKAMPEIKKIYSKPYT